MRKLEDYLKLDKTRDVIEWQLDDTLDISGWDLKKALQLMHESNPSIFEWCASPIVYRCSPAFEELQEIRKEYYSKKKSLYHYWHMASSNYENYLQGEEVRIKKYFYVIRPLLAAKWIADHGTQPPMLFRELLDAELPEELRAIVNELLDKKQKMPEMGLAPKIKELDCFIKKELETIRLAADQADMGYPEPLFHEAGDRTSGSESIRNAAVHWHRSDCLDKVRQSKWKDINRIERNRN